MEFDKMQAIEVIEDAPTDIDTPHGRGVAVGLCGAFHMCGLINADEWEACLARIPVELECSNTDQPSSESQTKH